MRQPVVVEPAVCLGCGCACDDIAVVVQQGRIVEARNACALGRRWFGDGTLPTRILVQGRDVSLDRALDAAAHLLTSARSTVVYLAADLTCEAQRMAVAIADRLGARLDTLTSSDGALPWVLAGQHRGTATATLGEVRNRGDVILFWGVDPAVRYPRWRERFLPSDGALHLSGARTLLAVDVGENRGPPDAGLHLVVEPQGEIDALDRLRAALRGRGDGGGTERGGTLAALARSLSSATYAVIVCDVDRGEDGTPDEIATARADGLTALAQQLNALTRCTLCALRGGGNRAGADSVLLWQTGFPAAVDFARGWPRYCPGEPTSPAAPASLVVGAVGSVPRATAATLARGSCVVVGPRASEGGLVATVAVDTGVAGIHEPGTALRMDDVPLPVRPSVGGARDAAMVIQALAARLGTSVDTSVDAPAGVPDAGAPDTGAPDTGAPDAMDPRRGAAAEAR